MSESANASAEATVLAYLRAYVTPDMSERRALLDQCWAEDGVYQDPNTRLEGRTNMLASIESFHQRLPGATFKMASGVDEHHGMLRFRWTMLGADGTAQVEGFDIGELDAAGRLKRITGFFGPFPPPPATWDRQFVDQRE
ncbi:MAG: nuclear transport factor 2 family protein [Chloroflexi bacterium]|nr:nuclear transport factor 2 family protein [Chloroflexota bacterium]